MSTVLLLELRLPAYPMTYSPATTIAAVWDKAQGYQVHVDGMPRSATYPTAERTVDAALRLVRVTMRNAGRM